MADKKQAVVIIHGMGEQRPMETLRSFVKSVWEMDPSLRGDNLSEVEPRLENTKSTKEKPVKKLISRIKRRAKPRIDVDDKGNNWWLKPDTIDGLMELSRVTTGPLSGEANDQNWPLSEGPGRRTDFYEFYWADLIRGTTIGQLFAWVGGLLLRSPRQVPADAFAIWIVLWGIVLSLASFSFVTLAKYFGPTDFDFNMSYYVAPWLISMFSALGSGIRAVLEVQAVGSALQLISSLLVMAYLLWEMLKLVSKRFFNSWQVWLTIVFAVLAVFVFWPTITYLAFAINWPTVLLVIGAYEANRFLIKYFGDMARYLQANPDNVELRNKVRERGLALLTNLHESGDYDRIVVVSHSQGSIIAYDLISLLWNRLGPTFNNIASDSARKPLMELDDYLRKAVADQSNPFDLKEYRTKQRVVSASMNSFPFVRDETSGTIMSSPWLISDLVTLGSPLSHAEFLLSRDTQGLRKLVRERLMPVCPPVLESKTARNDQGDVKFTDPSFLYAAGSESKLFAHHASCFAAVRWTNICDVPPFYTFVLGDPLSGPVVGNFGSSIRVVGGAEQERELWNEKQPPNGWRKTIGINEIQVKITKKRTLLPDRLFTHSLYWEWQQEFDQDAPPPHITALREAINLAEPPQV